MFTIAVIYTLVRMAATEDQTQRFLVEWYWSAGARPLDRRNRRSTQQARRIHIESRKAGPTADGDGRAGQYDYAFGVFVAESAEIVAQVCGDAAAPPQRISSAVGWMQAPDR